MHISYEALSLLLHVIVFRQKNSPCFKYILAHSGLLSPATVLNEKQIQMIKKEAKLANYAFYLDKLSLPKNLCLFPQKEVTVGREIKLKQDVTHSSAQFYEKWEKPCLGKKIFDLYFKTLVQLMANLKKKSWRGAWNPLYTAAHHPAVTETFWLNFCQISLKQFMITTCKFQQES